MLAYVPITFEHTVLFSAIGMTVSFYYLCKLWPGKKPKIIDERTTDHLFALTFELDNSTILNYSDKDVKDDFAGFGVAGVLGFGIDIKLTDMINLTTGLRFGYKFTDSTTEYSEDEFTAASTLEELSNVSGVAHTDTEDKFSYQKSNRAFGGLQIGIQFMLDKK